MCVVEGAAYRYYYTPPGELLELNCLIQKRNCEIVAQFTLNYISFVVLCT